MDVTLRIWTVSTCIYKVLYTSKIFKRLYSKVIETKSIRLSDTTFYAKDQKPEIQLVHADVLKSGASKSLVLCKKWSRHSLFHPSA